MSRFKIKTLFVKYLRGECDPDELTQVQSLKADPKNKAEIVQLQTTLELLAQIQQEKTQEPTKALTDSVMRKVRHSTAEPILYRRSTWAMAAISSFLICFFIILPSQVQIKDSPQITTSSVANPVISDLKTYSADDTPEFNDERISNSFDRVLTFLEGSFGALLMLSFGLAAIVFALVGGATKNRKYIKIAALCLFLAISVFLTRSFISSFFNASNSALIGE